MRYAFFLSRHRLDRIPLISTLPYSYLPLITYLESFLRSRSRQRSLLSFLRLLDSTIVYSRSPIHITSVSAFPSISYLCCKETESSDFPHRCSRGSARSNGATPRGHIKSYKGAFRSVPSPPIERLHLDFVATLAITYFAQSSPNFSSSCSVFSQGNERDAALRVVGSEPIYEEACSFRFNPSKVPRLYPPRASSLFFLFPLFSFLELHLDHRIVVGMSTSSSYCYPGVSGADRSLPPFKVVLKQPWGSRLTGRSRNLPSRAEQDMHGNLSALLDKSGVL